MDVIKHDLLTVFGKRRFASILADPPWRFTNKSGKIAPEHRRLTRYGTMRLDEILALPVVHLLGAALNFAMILTTSRPVFNLPFKALDEIPESRTVLSGLHLQPRKS